MNKLWYIVQKDLLAEWRARQVWPRLLALGLAVGYLLGYQLSGSVVDLPTLAGSLCWMTVCIASVLTLGQAVTVEREDGCWDGLRQYPVTASTIFLAKLIVNFTMLAAAECIILPLFALTLDTTLPHAGAIVTVAVLSNIGISAVGTLVGAMSTDVRQSQGLLALLMLPLLVPAVLAASKATTLTLLNQTGAEWWHWVQLLGIFAVLYVTAGLMLFEFVIEE